MQCPTCNYVMSDFDKDCPRCERLNAQAQITTIGTARAVPASSSVGGGGAADGKKAGLLILLAVASLVVVAAVMFSSTPDKNAHSGQAAPPQARNPTPAAPPAPSAGTQSANGSPVTPDSATKVGGVQAGEAASSKGDDDPLAYCRLEKTSKSAYQDAYRRCLPPLAGISGCVDFEGTVDPVDEDRFRWLATNRTNRTIDIEVIGRRVTATNVITNGRCSLLYRHIPPGASGSTWEWLDLKDNFEPTYLKIGFSED